MCTPTSSFTPTKKKFIAMQQFHEGKLKESIPTQFKQPMIDPENISILFDRMMEKIDTFPQKLLLHLVERNCVALRVGYGTVIRFFG